MFDVAAIGTMLGSLKAAFDLTQSAIDARDARVIRDIVVKLQGEIISAQASAFAAQTAQSTLLNRVGELEKEVTDLKAWDTEKEKYELQNVRDERAPGGKAFAYVLKANASSTEPIHSICPDCYQDRRKSILQGIRADMGGTDMLMCNRCGLVLNLTGVSYGMPPTPHPNKRR